MWFLIITLFPNKSPSNIFMGHAVSIVLYTFLFLKFNVKFRDYLKYLMLGTLLFASTIIMSQLANYDRIGFSLAQLRYAFVPFYWIFGLQAGIIDAKIFSSRKRNFFFSIAAIFIIVQIPLVLLQIIGLDNFLWTAEKARDWTGILRVVGTVQNPNTLGFLTIFCIIIFIHFSKKKPFWSRILIGFSLLIVLATGSRTSLIILLVLPLIFISKDQLLSKKVIYILMIVTISLYLLYVFLFYFKDSFPYMSQLLNLLEGRSIHALDSRFSLWKDIRELYFSSPIKTKLFGFGPGYFGTLDNSYFYGLYNYGIFSSLFFLPLLFLLFKTSQKTGIKIAQKSLFLLLICGFVTDAIFSFLFMTIIYYFIGLQSHQSLHKHI